MPSKVFVHLVTYNSADYAEPCIRAVLEQDGFDFGRNLTVLVTDNASSDGVLERLGAAFKDVLRRQNRFNLGFSGAHNQGVQEFLASDAEYLLILNPDVRLSKECLSALVHSLERCPAAGMATPLLLRCDKNLNPVEPPVVDAAGMYMTPNLRHLDRGSGEPLEDRFKTPVKVFGGTGACLLLRRSFVVDASFRAEYDEDAFNIYPELREGQASRVQLFDEAFFAYREDADLAWRAQILGWSCVYEPSAIAYHKRAVVPEKRSSLSPVLNLLSVRNRFLLQLNNFQPNEQRHCILPGIFIRNILVVGGVVLQERSSLPALKQALALRRRALSRRRYLLSRAKRTGRSIGAWFQPSPRTDPL